MTRKYLLNLTPSLLIAAGILVSTYVAGLTANSGWIVLVAPLLLSLVILAADVLISRLRGTPSGPSPVALLSAGSILLASIIVALRDPGLVRTLIPVIGVTSWVTLMQPNKQRKTCRTV
jgi:uncharacterized protein YqgC (DUF456 family)